VPSTNEHRHGFEPGGAYKNDTVGTGEHSNYRLACGEHIYRDVGEGSIFYNTHESDIYTFFPPERIGEGCSDGKGRYLIASET